VSSLVTLDRSDGVAWLTLDRPEVMNALSFQTLQELSAHVALLAADRETRVVMITGAGDRAFCAGADLKERVGFTEEQTRAFVALIGDTFTEVARLPQPTIAVMGGVAYGGGLELALACDMRIAAQGVKMGLTETSLAIIPGAGGTQRLPAVVGVARAKELILSSRRVDADEAGAMGLVNRVVPRDSLRAAADELAGAIAACGPLAVRAAKQAIDVAQEGGEMNARLLAERQLYLDQVLPSSDRLEALAAFREKRKPRFKGE
jgi:enoyl-CoA hydratase/carnithine racemase